MNKKLIYSLSGIGIILAFGLMYFNAQENEQTTVSTYSSSLSNSPAPTEESQAKTNAVASAEYMEPTEPAEKIQVFVFHSTNRCHSCIALGQLAQKTLDQNFADELKSGKIEFGEINIDLPENEELAEKFQATGSSLFINSIIQGKDSIKEDVQVWRLISNKKDFLAYLSTKLNKMLGK